MVVRRRRGLPLLLILSTFIAFIAVVDGKLLLWSKSEAEPRGDDERRNARYSNRHDGAIDGKPAGRTNGENTIRQRLKLFHKQGDDDEGDEASVEARAEQHQFSLSPAVYLDIMFNYIREMSDYLYTSSTSNDDYDARSNSSSSSSSSATSSAAYELYRLARHNKEYMMLSEPKDAWEGVLSAFAALRTGYFGGVRSLTNGVYELGESTISACIALFNGGGMPNNDDHPPTLAFFSELAYGLRRGANHAADGLYLFAAGAVVGTRNLIVGISRTPRAMQAASLGMMYYPAGNRQIAHGDISGQQQQRQREVAVWDYYSLDYEDREIRIEEERMKKEHAAAEQYGQATADRRRETQQQHVRRRRGRASVKDRRYYDMLGVSPDANHKEIRSAYRKEALKRHPDKQQPGAGASAPHSTSAEEGTHVIEGFLDLTEAYRILSNDASRDAYDQHGLCFREEAATLPSEDDEANRAQYIDLIDELFGASAVRDYVGTVQIAPIVNEMFGFSPQSSGGSSSRNRRMMSVEMQNLQQRRRVVDVAVHIRDRVNSYVRGEVSLDEYTSSCRKEANFILRSGGEEITAAFLRVVGSTLREEADQHIGYVLPFVRKTISESSQRVKSSIANARVYAPIYFRAALEGLVMGSSYDDGESDADDVDCTGRRKSSKEPVSQDAVLDLLWQHVLNDSVATLRAACEKVFADRGARDASLAFVKSPSMVKYQRAEAIRILANEMIAASSEVIGRK